MESRCVTVWDEPICSIGSAAGRMFSEQLHSRAGR